MAGCGSASSFNRPTSLGIAHYRRALAPRLAPLSGLLRAAPPISPSRETESNLRLHLSFWPGIPTQAAISFGATCLAPRRPRQTTRRAAPPVGTTIHTRSAVTFPPTQALPRRQAAPGHPAPRTPDPLPRRHPAQSARTATRLDTHQGITQAEPGPSVPCPPRATMPARDRRRTPVLRTCR